MKIYVNELHQIKALRVNDTDIDTLTEIEVEDNVLPNYCDTVLKSFCYHRMIDSSGNETLAIYPYKDFLMLETVQELNDLREQLRAFAEDIAVDNDFRLTLLEI